MLKSHNESSVGDTPVPSAPVSGFVTADRQREKSSLVRSNDATVAQGRTFHILELPIDASEMISEKRGVTMSVRNNLDVVFEKIDGSRIDLDGGIKAEDEVPVCYGPKSSTETSEVIVSLLEKHRMAPRDQSQQEWLAKGKFLKLIRHHMERGQVIPMVLPAFPFKSPNKTFKVLGNLPDKGEEVALAHLDGLCRAIEDVYRKGARVDIVSDGLMYNDLLRISDKEVWTYGQALRKLATDMGYNHINFVRLVNLLVESEIGEPMSEEQYLRDASYFRTEIYRRNIPKDFDPSIHIANDLDTTLTYRGYIKFLERDLEDSLFGDTSASKRQIKKQREETARNMISRGRAFAIAIATKFDDSIRLSIHPSTDAKKISISLIPQKGKTIMTPWHSSLVRSLDGSIHMEHAGSVSAVTHDLVFENGRPSHFRERSALFNWESYDVDFEYMYPSGILISPRNKTSKCSLRNVDMHKVRALTDICSPVILRGFEYMTDTITSVGVDTGKGVQRAPGAVQVAGNGSWNGQMADSVATSKPTPLLSGGRHEFPRQGIENAPENSDSYPTHPAHLRHLVVKTPVLLEAAYAPFAGAGHCFPRRPEPALSRRIIQDQQGLRERQPKGNSREETIFGWKALSDWSEMCNVG